MDFKTGLYDSETKILEFDVKVCVVCKNYADTPPTELHVYAILTDSNGMSIEPGHLDMSECGTHEAVATQVVVRNDSLVRQEYGFLDLPPVSWY